MEIGNISGLKMKFNIYSTIMVLLSITVLLSIPHMSYQQIMNATDLHDAVKFNPKDIEIHKKITFGNIIGPVSVFPNKNEIIVTTCYTSDAIKNTTGGYLDSPADAYGNVNRTYANANFDFSTHCDVDYNMVDSMQAVRIYDTANYVLHIPDESFSIKSPLNETQNFLHDNIISAYKLVHYGHPRQAQNILQNLQNAVNGVSNEQSDQLIKTLNFSPKEYANAKIGDTTVLNEVNSRLNGLIQMISLDSSPTVIPEYGAVTTLVFAIAISAIIIASMRNGLYDKHFL
jgi:predicted secreted protein with PEFG-CTERM motif